MDLAELKKLLKYVDDANFIRAMYRVKQVCVI